MNKHNHIPLQDYTLLAKPTKNSDEKISTNFNHLPQSPERITKEKSPKQINQKRRINRKLQEKNSNIKKKLDHNNANHLDFEISQEIIPN